MLTNMKLKKEQVGATFFHPDGSIIELNNDSQLLEKVYKVAPSLFEEEEKAKEPKPQKGAK